MALVLAKLDQKKSWQPVEVKLPSSKGFITQRFEVEFILPSDDDFADIIKEKTIKECLEMWINNARGIQADEKNAKEVEFTPEVKKQLLGNNKLQASMWESLQNALSGGRLKN